MSPSELLRDHEDPTPRCSMVRRVMMKGERQSAIFRRFVYRALRIESIPHEDLYLTAWMIDLLLLVYSLARVFSGSRGRNLLYGGAAFLGLVGLIWWGGRHGQRSSVVPGSRREEVVPVLLQVHLSPRNRDKMERLKGMGKMESELSRLIDGWLDRLTAKEERNGK